jgi:hypothetical protein
MIRNETFVNGSCVKADIIDLDTGLVTVEEDGVIVGQRPINDEEREQFRQHPLSDLGALATLLAVEQVLSVQDAANAVGLTEQDLVNEALAWGAANP